jgi:hypothetical protein
MSTSAFDLAPDEATLTNSDVAGLNIDPVEEIETVIASLAEPDSAMVNRSETGHLWKFRYGSVEVFVQLAGTSDDDTLTVWSPVLKLPVQREAELLRKLMVMNTNTFEARFAISEDQIVVMTARTLAGLTPAEVSRSITVVASIADDNDETLIAEFGTT